MKNKIEIKSILRNTIKNIETTLDLEEAKQIVIREVKLHDIKEMDKRKMILDVYRQTTTLGLTKYLWNALLKFEGDAVIKTSLRGGNIK
jgi:hypothetical protein